MHCKICERSRFGESRKISFLKRSAVLKASKPPGKGMELRILFAARMSRDSGNRCVELHSAPDAGIPDEPGTAF